MTPKITRPIFLIGMMGSGKSSIGRRLARRLRLPFVDLDAQIQESAGMTIAELFQRHGEGHFRQLETEFLARSLGESAIIATGGGVVVTPENCALLQRAAAEGAQVVYLHADPRTLARRAAMQPASRPLLLGESGTFDFRKALLRLEQLLSVRDPLYRDCATLVVDVATRKPGAIEAEIAAFLDSGRPAC